MTCFRLQLETVLEKWTSSEHPGNPDKPVFVRFDQFLRDINTCSLDGWCTQVNVDGQLPVAVAYILNTNGICLYEHKTW